MYASSRLTTANEISGIKSEDSHAKMADTSSASNVVDDTTNEMSGGSSKTIKSESDNANNATTNGNESSPPKQHQLFVGGNSDPQAFNIADQFSSAPCPLTSTSDISSENASKKRKYNNTIIASESGNTNANNATTNGNESSLPNQEQFVGGNSDPQAINTTDYLSSAQCPPTTSDMSSETAPKKPKCNNINNSSSSPLPPSSTTTYQPAPPTSTTTTTQTTTIPPSSSLLPITPNPSQLTPTTPQTTTTTTPHTTTPINIPTNNIRTPHNHDVLCGRGGGTNNHIGNENFRDLVNEKKRLYLNSSKREKPLVSKSIVEAIRMQNPPGRFLQKDETTGLWYDIGDQKAREKTSQALREGAPVIRKEMVHGVKMNGMQTQGLVAASKRKSKVGKQEGGGGGGGVVLRPLGVQQQQGGWNVGEMGQPIQQQNNQTISMSSPPQSNIPTTHITLPPFNHHVSPPPAMLQTHNVPQRLNVPNNYVRANSITAQPPPNPASLPPLPLHRSDSLTTYCSQQQQQQQPPPPHTILPNTTTTTTQFSTQQPQQPIRMSRSDSFTLTSIRPAQQHVSRNNSFTQQVPSGTTNVQHPYHPHPQQQQQQQRQWPTPIVVVKTEPQSYYIPPVEATTTTTITTTTEEKPHPSSSSSSYPLSSQIQNRLVLEDVMTRTIATEGVLTEQLYHNEKVMRFCQDAALMGLEWKDVERKLEEVVVIGGGGGNLQDLELWILEQVRTGLDHQGCGGGTTTTTREDEAAVLHQQQQQQQTESVSVHQDNGENGTRNRCLLSEEKLPMDDGETNEGVVGTTTIAPAPTPTPKTAII